MDVNTAQLCGLCGLLFSFFFGVGVGEIIGLPLVSLRQ